MDNQGKGAAQKENDGIMRNMASALDIGVCLPCFSLDTMQLRWRNWLEAAVSLAGKAKAANRKTSSKRASGHAASVSNIVYKLRGYPDDIQASELLRNIGGCRFLWNRMKADRDTLYSELGIVIKNTPADYKDIEGLEWLCDLDSYALLNVQLNLERTYSDFMSGKCGFPRFKKKYHCRASYTTNKDKRSNNIKLEHGRLTLPKITGTIKVTCHRDIPDGLTLKACTVVHEPDGKWIFNMLYEYPVQDESGNDTCSLLAKPVSKWKHIGLDMSLPFLYMDSYGNKASYENAGNNILFPKPYKHMEQKIAREQRKLSHKQPHGKNYEKQAIKVARLHAKTKQQRHDFLEQLTTRLAREYDIISIESLDIAAMKRSLKFGKSVSDNGWGAFVAMLERKCHKYGTLLVMVDKWFPSSKTCSHCGHIHNDLILGERTYICPHCGHTMDRDIQAAVNIDNEGLRLVMEAYLPKAA